MYPITLPNSKFSYSHNHQKEPSQAIDVHDIFIVKSKVRVLLSYVGTLLFLAIVFYSLLLQENFSTNSIWSTWLGALLAKALQYKPVKKESIVIMPAFGVQLETHFWSYLLLELGFYPPRGGRTNASIQGIAPACENTAPCLEGFMRCHRP